MSENQKTLIFDQRYSTCQISELSNSEQNRLSAVYNLFCGVSFRRDGWMRPYSPVPISGED